MHTHIHRQTHTHRHTDTHACMREPSIIPGNFELSETVKLRHFCTCSCTHGCGQTIGLNSTNKHYPHNPNLQNLERQAAFMRKSEQRIHFFLLHAWTLRHCNLESGEFQGKALLVWALQFPQGLRLSETSIACSSEPVSFTQLT